VRAAHASLLALGALAALGGCIASPSTSCRSDGDCGGGVCVAGACRSLAGDLRAGGDGGATPDFGGSAADLRGSGGDLSLAGDAIAPTCNLNGDGVIDRTEAPFVVGLGGLFEVNAAGQNVPVSLARGTTTWDFTAATSSDHKVFDQLISPQSQWWSSSFPTATHAQILDDGQALFGVYRATSSALELLGVVSSQGGVTSTLLTYATPIPMLKFPISVGQSYTAESDVSGLASGVGFFAHEKYVFSVEKRGTTKVEAGDFDTLRMSVHYTQTYGLLITTRTIYL